MPEPVLTIKDLDELISSDTYVPEEDSETEAAAITAPAQPVAGNAFATYTELNPLAKNGVSELTVTKETATTRTLSDAAVGSFGDQTLELIIGNDDRKKVPDPTEFPWRKIAALVITSQSGSQYAGTACFISPRVLLTAGHCVFLHDAGGFAKTIEVIPAWGNNKQPFGKYDATLFKASNGWVNDRNSDYDYGLIILDEKADINIGWFAFAAASDENLSNQIVNVCGYPHDPDKWPNQYYHSREIDRSSKHKIYYTADSTGGQSGAGLWLTLGETERVIIGIHTTGSSTTNYGTRITEPMFNNFKRTKDDYQ
ncbi:MAG TPA: trypsin-like serine protease [Ohtaekwangia sp.]|uniref:trypsin-like serine peptidase n=1 Tax=Ohtaekwangia sp. TaxID=2066019 RepID=UPI002F9355C2